jgi:hypothetical protein
MPVSGDSQIILKKNGAQQHIHCSNLNGINKGVFSMGGITGDDYLVQYLLVLSSKMETGDSLVLSNCMLFDLTQMFGTTIADYVYGLEQSVEGSGIAWLQSYGFFTKDYYEYDAGSLQSVCTSGRKVTDSSGNERTYPIDDVQLRGLFKLDTNIKLYADGDIYPSSGSGRRKYGIVDLGSLTYTRYKANGFSTYDLSSIAKRPRNNDTAFNGISSMYQIRRISGTIPAGYMALGSDNGRLLVVNANYDDASEFKTAMSGQYLVYELATETTFSADPYINPQRSIESGTEEFVDGLTRDVMVPVGNVTQYYQSEIIPIISEYIDAIMASN